MALDPKEDCFYIRIEATTAGEYTTSILFTNGDYSNDDTDVRGMVIDTSLPWFIETFEVEEDKGNYNAGSFKGSSGVWNVTDFGLWKSDVAYKGNYAGRFGNESSSSISTASAKRNGIGTISFYAKRWSDKDGDASFAIEYSADGKEWTTATTVVFDKPDYTEYTIPVNAPGDNYLRLRQISGKRAMIDELSVTDAVSRVGKVNADAEKEWDAFCRGGELVIENGYESPHQFKVYAVDGTLKYTATIVKGEYAIKLPVGIYLVSSEKKAKKVIVK